ncbi:hypothetical protein [Rothia sp. CCM 9416]|uniref:hypothetical protein n=1 Tax=Rothia sp. CCM 9416 TaxID=3402655 RepID=UPI003AEC56A3
MTKTVQLTGTFLSPDGVPLRGSVTVSPAPEMVVAPQEYHIYAGPITLPLDDQGGISGEFISTEGWVYAVSFELFTQAGLPAPQRSHLIRLTEDTDLADLLEEKISGGLRRPVLTYSNYLPGEVTAAGATPDPDDEGAILVPVAAV